MFKSIKSTPTRKTSVNSVENYLLYLATWFKVRLNTCKLLVILNHVFLKSSFKNWKSVYNRMPTSFHWIAYILYCSLMSYMNYNRFSNEPKEKYIVHVGVIKINFILQIYQKYIVSLKKPLYIINRFTFI